MPENHENLGFVRIGNQPPVTPLTLNRIAKWEAQAVKTKQYTPYLKLKRTPTVGKGSKVFNPESDDSHETLSIMETRLLRYLDFLPNVISIKTQYPLLPINTTLEIADAMGVKHPSYTPKGKHIRPLLKVNQAVVMTTDYLIDYRDEGGVIEQCAIALKGVNEDGLFSEKQKRDVNIRNKLNIEAEFCRMDGLGWRLMTSAMQCFEEDFARNLLEAEVRSELEIDEELLVKVEEAFKRRFRDMPRACFATLLSEIALQLNHSTGKIRGSFWKLIWQQRLPVDISKEIIFNRPLPIGEKLWNWQ
jgi:hypothetical protein